ncbi:hypothetical protein EJ05DRAFT_496242 [Pseudovirgaria hyperparasitica]|uniref:RNase P subunit Pop3 n=1 Tax=Pseudovirgaria hyperparasitica TaxID=470096 RepID=A0A6A6WMH7_9PEZI|nr:uncharacterized protein EJ05DRAFT_496242 [Pseudovirgaria hyperparasitica]KAF2763411.1 hypothetical protein EJ05DRAFT_496242 [Pseudovirgaria hyperparasitica]
MTETTKVLTQKSRGGRQTFKTDLPAGASLWPTINSQDTNLMLEMLLRLLQPIGHHRSINPPPSSVKRNRKRKRLSPSSELNPSSRTGSSSPEISRHVVVGINSINRRLEQQAQHRKAEPDQRSDESPANICLIFVPSSPSTKIPVQFQHLPVLARTAADAPALLIPLPLAAEKDLAKALRIARVSAVSICENAPSAEVLIEFCKKQVKPVNVPWLELALDGAIKWKGTQILIEET